MKPFVSIDLETTGLDPRWCQVLEIAAVIATDDYTPVDKLPTFQCYLVRTHVVGDPYALWMNATILHRIATKAPGFTYYQPDEAIPALATFLEANGIDTKHVVAAGKNFAGFDLQFLKELPCFRDRLNFKHRVLDPAMLYWDPTTDAFPPSTEDCLTRAMLWHAVKHEAVDDARDVINLIRKGAEKAPYRTAA